MDNALRVSVFGAGYVGLVTAAGLAAIGHHVLCVDVDEKKISSLTNGEVPFFEPGLPEMISRGVASQNLCFTSSLTMAIDHGQVIIIGVGTPPLSSGAADLSQVLSVAASIGMHIQHRAVVVVKSTVPVGTSELVHEAIQDELDRRGDSVSFSVASNPEFLKEGDAVRDFMVPDRIVIGVSDEWAGDVLGLLYEPLCKSVGVLMKMSTRSSEMCKYAANAMLATRISFMNEMARLSDIVGADICEIQRVMAADPRIGSKYLNAGAGFGGSCFPKDLRAIRAMGIDFDCDLPLIESVIEVNTRQQTVLIDKAREVLGSLKGKRCAVWGLAFKPDTDDIREAPALHLIHALLAEGATIVAHDPVVQWLPMYSSLSPDLFHIVDDPYAAIADTDVLFLVTEWSEYRTIDVQRMTDLVGDGVIVDGRNIWAKIDFTGTDVAYLGIGRQSNVEQVRETYAVELAG